MSNNRFSPVASQTLIARASAAGLFACLLAAPAHAALVSACSGVSLPPSVVTGILQPVLNGVVNPLQTDVNAILGVPLIGGVLGLPPLSINLTGPGGLLTNAAAGAPITLSVLKTNGTVIGPADTCNTTTDSLQLNTPAGLALGGNQITGLGNGAPASAGELNSIAVGNGATTAPAATTSVALGNGASVSAPNSVALGAGSTATRGAANGSAGEVSVGAPGATRQITNVAAGTAPTDAATVGQVTASAGAAPIQYSDPAAPTTPTPGVASNSTTLVGTAAGTPVALHNVAAGALTPTSTDAVNGGQLAATNATVAGNTTNIANNTTAITNLNNGTAGLVQQATPTSPVTVAAATGGTSINLAGTGGNRVVSGVAAGVAPTDAVNVGQLNATNTTVAGNTTAITNLNTGAAGTVQRTPAANGLALTATGGTGAAPGAAQTLSNVAAGVAPTDAVNVGQLTTTNTNVAGNTTAITNLTNGVNNGAVGLVQQTGGAPGSGQITVGAATGGTSINLAGTGGNRVVSGVAAGVAPTDAANVGQLTGAIGAATANSVLYDTTAGGVRTNRVTLAGGAAGPVTVTNVGPGALTPASTDAVNGSQLAATNATVAGNTASIATNTANIAGNTANISGNTTAIVNLNTGTAGTVQRGPAANKLVLTAAGGTGAAPGAAQVLSNVAPGVAGTDAVDLGQVNGLIAASSAAGPLQYSNPAAPTTPTPGVVSNSTTLVGTAAGSPVAVHNVAAGILSPTSTDAVNGSQLAATNTTVAGNTASIAGNTANIAGNTTAITNLTAGVNNGTVGLVQQTGGAPGNGQITVGAASGGTSVTIAGTGGNRTLTGLNAGLAGNDAVTVAQVNGLTGNGLNNVQYDPTAAGGRSNTITLAGGTPGTVRITNVTPGALTAGSTDAVNGAQLAATNATVAGNTTAITNLTNGSAGAFQSNNAAAAAAPIASGANASAGGFGASATGAGGLALGNGATSTGTGSVALGQGSTDGGAARVVSVGGVGSERRITNVGPAVNGTDAVNLSQLQTATNSFTATAAGLQGQLNQTNFDLNQVRRRANGGTAGAMAVAGLPQAFEPGKSMIGGAVGYWADQVAFAIGVSSIVGERTVVKAGGSISNQGVGGFNAGIGFQF